jgi:photosystem II stability/assembly factor-like uncharacterized protein
MEGLHCLGTSSIAVHPRNADEVLVYTQALWEKPREPEEGLYRSTDGGATWKRVVAARNEDKRRGQRKLIAFTPDGAKAYFMAYKGEQGEGGLYRSDDSGATWKGPLSLQGVVAQELAVDARVPTRLYVAAEDGLHISGDEGATFTRSPAIDGAVSCVVADPAMAGHVYVVQGGVGLLRSEDAGRTFKPIPCGDPALDAEASKVFISPVDPRRMILAPGTKGKKMRVSHDRGRIWREPRINFTRSYVQQGVWGLDEGFAWSTRNTQQIIGGISCTMFRSTDGGLTWDDASTGYLGFHHGWSDGAVTFLAGDPKTFAFFCYDYAFNLTTDGGRTFQYGRLKEQVRGWWGMYAGDLSPNFRKDRTVIVAAGQYWRNQLCRSEDAGKTWTAIPDTDGAYFFVRFHPKDPKVVYADNRRSDDGGRTFKELPYPVYACAPSNPDTVYGWKKDEGKLMRSDDRGETWRALPDAPRRVNEWIGRRDCEVDPRDPDKVWVMTPPHCSVFDGKQWRMIEAANWVDPKGHPFVSRMAIDPDRPQRIIIGLDTHGTSYLFLSEDAGATWQDITGNLPRLGSNQSLNIQPKTGRIFIGAGFGTWTTELKPPAAGGP